MHCAVPQLDRQTNVFTLTSRILANVTDVYIFVSIYDLQFKIVIYSSSRRGKIFYYTI